MSLVFISYFHCPSDFSPLLLALLSLPCCLLPLDFSSLWSSSPWEQQLEWLSACGQGMEAPMVFPPPQKSSCDQSRLLVSFGQWSPLSKASTLRTRKRKPSLSFHFPLCSSSCISWFGAVTVGSPLSVHFWTEIISGEEAMGSVIQWWSSIPMGLPCFTSCGLAADVCVSCDDATGRNPWLIKTIKNRNPIKLCGGRKNKDTSSWGFCVIVFSMLAQCCLMELRKQYKGAGTFHWFLQYVGQPKVSCGQSTVAWQSYEFSGVVPKVVAL